IVPFEEAEQAGRDGDARAVIRRPSAPGEHVREAGADVPRGETVLEAGRELSPQDVALAAALGVARGAASPQPRAAGRSTGAEALLDVDQPRPPGAMRDSNLPMLVLLAQASGGNVSIMERLPDHAERVARFVREALESSDVVLTIGGVSAGDFDPVKEALAGL